MLKRARFMLKNKITVKLFLILSGCLILFTAIIVLVQLFVVGRMFQTTEYTVKRENDLSEILLKFEYDYSSLSQQRQDAQNNITTLLQNYGDANKAYFLILDSSYNIKYAPQNTRKALGDYYLNNIEQTFKANKAYNQYGAHFRVQGLFGLPSKYIAVFTEIKPLSETVVSVTAEVHTGDDEAVLKQYVIYVFVFGISLSFLLAALFSVFVTRPVIKMRDTAAKMTRLDFREKCTVHSADEIGDLAMSLNFLSEKLDGTLNELYQANEKLKNDLDFQKEIDLLRKEFIAAVSHEFKTPLTLIRGYTEGMQDHLVKEENIEGAQAIIVDEVDKMDRLVQELLELSKLESGGYVLNKQDFSMDEMLREVSEKYSIIMKERQFVFVCNLSCGKKTVNADKFRMEQVVTNFLNNAMSNTPSGGAISLKSEMMGDSMNVSVLNEGTPIPLQDISKIWDRFYRCDKSRSRITGGTGLGLTICKAILEKHGAQFGARNLDCGVEFYFTLKAEN